ncbi:uncharacterized protein F5147DRAFT_764790 [Suillus discolor]|uniref:CHAT domain-containing protein n=1 Tax=Suillus discolor TaxID=1912936 RepID=A0A9P7ETL0_9AGAM|nr:uncharacterized protein F5147DRAFT_764790 [Suillus discolor]KAG2087688.1 hypothetical protein F5147DRAFT_764790 [Suillus discolor]
MSDLKASPSTLPSYLLHHPHTRPTVISGNNIQVPSWRIPAGIYISVNVDSRRRWKSPISVLSFGTSVTWGNSVTLLSHASRALSVEIRASYELGRMLGGGEVVGTLRMSWDELLDHGDEPFDLLFPPVRGVHPSLKLKAAIVHACDDQDDALIDSLADCEIARDTDAGHAQFAAYVTSKTVSRLKRAVKHFQLVLDRCPVSHPDHATALTNLAWARLKGYIRNDLEDIDATTSLFREALALRPQPHPDFPLSLYNLTEALNWRHDKKSTAADIREATQLYHELLPHCPEATYLRSIVAGENGVDYTHLMKASTFEESSSSSVLWAINSVQTHLTHFHVLSDHGLQCGHIDDLDEGIQFKREAVSLYPEGHAVRDNYLNDLAGLLMYRFNHQGKPDDLDEAISLLEELLRVRPVGHKFRDDSLVSLGNALRLRFHKHGDIDDITRAIGLCREALTLRPPGHLLHASALDNLASALHARHDKSHVSDDRDEAIDLYRESLRSRQPDNPDRHLTLSNLSVELYSRFLQTRGTSDLSSRHPTEGFPRRIMELLIGLAKQKSGRGQQWSLASRLRTPVEDLETAKPTLARNYLELSKRISNAAQGSANITDRAAADQEVTEYRRLTRQWDAAVAEIRDIPAFSRFLLPPWYEDLQVAARQGPVIILIASQYSCSAIIVPTSGDPHHVPLPSIALADLKILKDRFARAIREASRMSPRESRTDLIVLSRIIWDQIMLPIVNVLEHALKLQCRSRIWLCPTAAFTSIPLHAAHPFQTKADRSGKEPCLEDLYICSYTPTLSALIRSRQLMKKRVLPSFVAIGQGQPGAGKGKALLAVDSELELVHKLVPATANHTSISGDEATRAGALSALQQNTWVHLACHGKQDPKQPYDSHFAEFAFLSACHTAVGDEETPDEVIHLAAGLQFSGFKSVVGTLWEVDDSVAKHVVEAFYRYMFRDLKDGGVMDCTKAAWALNCAMHSVKMKVPLEQRMVFVHIVIALCRSGAPDVPNGPRMGTSLHRPIHAHWCRPRVLRWYWPTTEVWEWYWPTTAYTCILVLAREVWDWYWPTTAYTCILVLARGVNVVLADHCIYMYIGANHRCTLVLARGVGVVPADHCLHMYIGAGQRCGSGTGRPLPTHVYWCWPEVWDWYWPTIQVRLPIHTHQYQPTP